MADGDGSGVGGKKVLPGGEPKGVEGAKARGRAAKEAWIRDGLLVSRETVAQRWGVSLADVEGMVARGELFELEVAGQKWVPAVFLELPRDVVAEVNRALAEAGADEATAFVFWHRKHGALGGLELPSLLRRSSTKKQALELAILFSATFRNSGQATPRKVRSK